MAPKYFGPFKVIAVIGKVAYKLQLLDSSKIHNVFHVSQLKQFRGTLPLVAEIPRDGQDQTTPLLPAAIMESRVIQVAGKDVHQYLINWQNKPPYEASWITKEDFEAKFLGFCHTLT